MGAAGTIGMCSSMAAFLIDWKENLGSFLSLFISLSETDPGERVLLVPAFSGRGSGERGRKKET